MSNSIKSKITFQAKYHPLRYFQSRASFIDKANQALPIDCISSDKNIVFSLLPHEAQESMDCFFNGFLEHIEASSSSEKYALKVRRYHKIVLQGGDVEPEYLFIEKLFQFDYLVFLQYKSLSNCGNNLFDFNHELLEIFQTTDVDDVLLRDITLPFSTVYLHFDGLTDKELDEGIDEIVTEKDKNKKKKEENISFLLDGAYVSQCPTTGSLQIFLTSARTQPSQNINNCIDSNERTIVLNLSMSDSNITIKEALELETEGLIKSNEKYIEEQIRYGFDFSQSEKDEILATSKSIVSQRVNLNTEYLKLVINCILYLQSYPEEIEEDDYVPDIYIKTKGFGKAVAIPKSQLNKLNFRKIKLCGRKKQLFKSVDLDDVDEDLLVDSDVENKRSLPAHKRRAHLRKQRYGEGRKHWKFVWIKETTIHRDKYQANQNQYRIYEIDDEAIG